MDIFKQPQLGQTILGLRQQKKLTQEELVERCNLNVRTLQRIEAGDVTPRDYTIRAILSALEFDLDKVESSINKKTATHRLQLAWIAGIAYFVIGFIEVLVDYIRFEDTPVYFPLIYIAVKVLMVVSMGLFIFGFVEVGKHFQNSLIKITAFLMLGSLFIIELYDIISIFSPMSGEEFVALKGMEAVAFGAVDIVFGFALIRLRKELGNAALVAGIFEILVGAFFLTFFLAFVGLLFMIPAIILEVIVLYKCYDLVSRK